MVSVTANDGNEAEPGDVVVATETGMVARVTGISHGEVTFETTWGYVDQISHEKFSNVFEIAEKQYI